MGIESIGLAMVKQKNLKAIALAMGALAGRSRWRKKEAVEKFVKSAKPGGFDRLEINRQTMLAG